MPSVRPRASAVLLAMILATVLAGCAQANAPSAPTDAGDTGAPRSAAATADDRPVPSVTASATSARSEAPATPATAAASGPPAIVDPSLISLLPPSIDGRPVVETPDAETGAVTDPSIARSVERLALAFVASEDGQDWAIASVARLRPGTWSESFYRDWRDSYDAGVCATHGGVGGNASTTIAGRQVEIATCGPLHTYHVHLEVRDVVVSVASVGERRYGEQLVAGLRP